MTTSTRTASTTTRQAVAYDRDGHRYIEIPSAYGSPKGTPNAFSTLFYADDFAGTLAGAGLVTLESVRSEYVAEYTAWHQSYFDLCGDYHRSYEGKLTA